MKNSYEFAITAVLNDTGISREEAQKITVEVQDELYYVSFYTDWQEYEAYVDASSFQVLGLNFRPLDNYLSEHDCETVSTVA